MTVLAIDAGTSGVRALAVDRSGRVRCRRYRELLPSSPAEGRVEFDATALADVAVELATDVIGADGPVDAVGITNQRASTVCWERTTGRPVGPGIGWQDRRAHPQVHRLAEAGVLVSPGTLGPLAAWHVEHSGREASDLRVGTIDTWLAWNLTGGRAFATDPSNLSGSVLWSPEHGGIDPVVLEALGLPRSLFADVVDTAQVVGPASALPGAPPVAALVGDQMASLMGHGATRPGRTKVTVGTGAMLDVALGTDPPASLLTASGCVPMVSRRVDGQVHWMLEAVMMAGGANVEWLRDGPGLVGSVEESDVLAASCSDAGGVTFVPAILGLGTPTWDLAATGLFHGITRSSGRPQLVRAVLEGVANGVADLVDAAATDSGYRIDRLSVDGGMSRNRTFVQAVADATGRPIDVAPAESTALGAAFLAGLAVGTWRDRADLDDAWAPERTVAPRGALDRAGWLEARRRSAPLDRPV